MSIHAADPKRSARLRRVLDFLVSRGKQGATTMEIIKHCDVCAINAIAAELRAGGYRVICDHRRPARYWIEGYTPETPEKATA